MDLITHIDDLPAYSPPGHSGTRNVRLVERDACGRFEMVLGEIAPGGVADAHHHDIEYQAMYVLEGQAEIRLDDAPARSCGPGSVVRIPPGTVHEVTASGDKPLKLLIVYSPPLPPRADVPLATDSGR